MEGYKIKVLHNDGTFEELSKDSIIKLAYDIALEILKMKYPTAKSSWDDMMQDAVMHINKKISKYDHQKGCIENYIWSGCSMIFAYFFRKKNKISRHETLVEEEDIRPPDEIPDESIVLGIDYDNFKKFIDTLDDDTKKAVRMKLNGATNVSIYNTLHPGNTKNIGSAMTTFWRKLGERYMKWRNDYED